MNMKKTFTKPITKLAKLMYGMDLSDDAANFCTDKVLSHMHFNHISVPVYAKNKLVNKAKDDSDERLMAIGYIKRFNAKTNEFMIVITGDPAEALKNIEDEDLNLVPVVKTDGGDFKTILKFIVYKDPSELDTVRLVVDKPRKNPKKD